FLLEERLGLRPRLRRRELHLDVGVAATLHLLHGEALAFQARAHALGRAVRLDLERLVDVHAQHEMDAALEVETEIDGLAGRIEVEDRDRRHHRHESDAEPEPARHQDALPPSALAGTMRPMADRSNSSRTWSATLMVPP